MLWTRDALRPAHGIQELYSSFLHHHVRPRLMLVIK